MLDHYVEAVRVAAKARKEAEDELSEATIRMGKAEIRVSETSRVFGEAQRALMKYVTSGSAE